LSIELALAPNSNNDFVVCGHDSFALQLARLLVKCPVVFIARRKGVGAFLDATVFEFTTESGFILPHYLSKPMRQVICPVTTIDTEPYDVLVLAIALALAILEASVEL